MKGLARARLRVVGLCGLVAFVSACSEVAGPTEPTFASFGVICDKDCPPPPEEGFGRMTGGGFIIDTDVGKVTFGLTLHCDVLLSNNLEINWSGANNWHLEKESLEDVSCVDDPNYDPVPPAAPFDTFIASADGKLNGEDGSRIEFRLVDDGEPGGADEAEFRIFAPDGTVALDVRGQLAGGNIQAHYDQPHGSQAP